MKRDRFVRLVLEWAAENLREFPWRDINDPYKIFIAEVLLKRTTSTAVKRVYKSFISEFPNLRSLLEANDSHLEEILRPIGLYKQRSKGLKEASEYIIKNSGGTFPSTYEELLRIPHVGPYTAGAVASFAFDRPVPIVDSNVKRVVDRVFGDTLSSSPNNAEVKELLGKIIPKEGHREFNLGLIDLGSLFCSYDEKECVGCPVEPVCSSSKEE